MHRRTVSTARFASLVAVASLFALGYGRHEPSPQRVLPYFPAYLAGMNLVVLADDAFSFLVAWEFMSLSSWALVLANHRAAENLRAGYIYILMATFGAVTLLLAFGLLAGPAQAAAGAVVVHGMGVHPDWNLINVLRSELAEQGYATLSVQMPVMAAGVPGEQYAPLFPEAAARIAAAASAAMIVDEPSPAALTMRSRSAGPSDRASPTLVQITVAPRSRFDSASPMHSASTALSAMAPSTRVVFPVPRNPSPRSSIPSARATAPSGLCAPSRRRSRPLAGPNAFSMSSIRPGQRAAAKPLRNASGETSAIPASRNASIVAAATAAFTA